jgi:hypothetical protein
MKTLILLTVLSLYAPNIRAEDWGLLYNLGKPAAPSGVYQQQEPQPGYQDFQQSNQQYQQYLQNSIRNNNSENDCEIYRDGWGKTRMRCQ